MDIDEYSAAAQEFAVYDPNLDPFYPAFGLAGEVGEVMEHIKKMLRDDDGALTEERQSALEKELGDVAWYWQQMCTVLGLQPSLVLKMNLDKLYDRKNRGVLHGSGSDR
jgi:NTP pyrophosphatase (non-canonical NTP hydrolase)